MTPLTLHFRCRYLQNRAQLYSKWLWRLVEWIRQSRGAEISAATPKYWPSSPMNEPLTVLHWVIIVGQNEGKKQLKDGQELDAELDSALLRR
jgi:hypothetical protein